MLEGPTHILKPSGRYKVQALLQGNHKRYTEKTGKDKA